jgi:hypothetical protein
LTDVFSRGRLGNSFGVFIGTSGLEVLGVRIFTGYKAFELYFGSISQKIWSIAWLFDPALKNRFHLNSEYPHA